MKLRLPQRATQEARRTKDYRYVPGAQKDAAEAHKLAAEAHGAGSKAHGEHMKIAKSHESKSNGSFR